ncbi:MAG: MATE family efflux transporter [Sphaerochaetaceae bacterium]|jgi:putative MATE family efflux protein|nr:MATE family efflux transporter [Sphaerochaetaceae bacterium]
MASHENNALLNGSRSPARTIWMLAWPVILDQSFNTMVQYVDSAMVGSLGPIATAAVGSNSSTIWLVHGLMYAFGAAFAVVAARQIGAGNTKAVQHTVRQALLAIVAFSIVVTTIMRSIAYRLPLWIGVDSQVVPDAGLYMSYIAAAYPFTILFAYMANLIRSSGDTRSPLISNIITNVANIIGNFFLIFPTRNIVLFGNEFSLYGADLGVEGAAIATAGATALSSLILFGVLLFKDSPLKTPFRGVSWKVDWSLMRTVFRLGTPHALERATLNVGQIVLTVLVTRIGTISLAAHHLAITAESITYMPVSAFSMAATTLVAQSLGAQRRELALDFAKRCLRWGVILMTITGTLMYIFSVQLMSFFTRDAQVIALGSRVLRIEAFAEPFFALSIVISGILRGSGDTKWPFINSIIGMWLVRLVPASILILGFGASLEVAWMCMVADLVVRGLLNYRRYRKGTWVDVWKD